jgi:hypothetical protein
VRYAALALVLLLAGVALWHFEREREIYTPIARLRSSDGLYMTIVQPGTARRSGCAAVLARFQEALKSTCPLCAVESAGCATDLGGIDRALARGERLPIYTISAQGIRVGLLGPPRSVHAECEAMASQFLRSGLQSASCVAPGPG